MILFVADQIAGAEYLFPLLRRWMARGITDWSVYGSDLATGFFKKKGIVCNVITNPAIVCETVHGCRPQKALMSASSNSKIEQSFRAALKQAGVPCYQFIDTWANYALRFHCIDSDGNAALDFPDKILTLDALARARMIEEGIPEDIIKIIGQPYFEDHYLRVTTEPAPSSKPNKTLLVTQPVAKYHGRGLGYDENDFLVTCLNAWRTAGLDWKLLGLAIHPEEDPKLHLNCIKSYSSKIAIVNNPSQKIPVCALLIGMFSSLLVQAVLFGVPAVSVQPNAAGRDVCHLSAQGIIPRVTEVAELAAYLDNFIRASNFAYPAKARAAFAEPFIGSCDRLEDFLLAST